MKSLGIILMLLALMTSLSAEAATRSGYVPVSNEFIAGGYFGGIKKGIFILNLSRQGQVRTYYVSPTLKVSYGGAEINASQLPLNTEISIKSDSSGFVTKVVVVEGRK